MGDSVTPKLDGNFSLSKNCPSRVFAPNSILFDDGDATFSKFSKITAPTPPENNSPNSSSNNPSTNNTNPNPDSLPPLFYLPLPNPTNTSKPANPPTLPKDTSAVFTLTPNTPIPALGKEQVSTLQGLYDDIVSEFEVRSCEKRSDQLRNNYLRS